MQEPTGPGSGDEVDLGNGPGEPGPGSGDELPPENEPKGPGSGDELPPDEDMSGPGSGEEIAVKGSCNAISFGSTCIDYIGSYWGTIENAIENCANVGTWSENPCPNDYKGGCNTNAGNSYENIIWHYGYGGDPFDQELIGYANTACTINPYGTWILGN